MRQAVILGLVLAVVFGRDALNAGLAASRAAAGNGAAAAPAAPLDVDRGISNDFRVHIAFCTS
jgi:hypothetical protein